MIVFRMSDALPVAAGGFGCFLGQDRPRARLRRHDLSTCGRGQHGSGEHDAELDERSLGNVERLQR